MVIGGQIGKESSQELANHCEDHPRYPRKRNYPGRSRPEHVTGLVAERQVAEQSSGNRYVLPTFMQEVRVSLAPWRPVEVEFIGVCWLDWDIRNWHFMLLFQVPITLFERDWPCPRNGVSRPKLIEVSALSLIIRKSNEKTTVKNHQHRSVITVGVVL